MTHFADQATATVVDILEHEQIAEKTMRLRLHAPEMAHTVIPGQFFMLRLPQENDPLIGRAFALYDRQPPDEQPDAPEWIEVVYIVKGKLTTRLAPLQAGQRIAVWGPLGNGFSTQPTDHLVMVAGGIGQTPFLALAREAIGQQQFGAALDRRHGYAGKVSLCYGARSANYLAGLDAFQSAGAEIHVATEDGSQGPPRLVTDALCELLDREVTKPQVDDVPEIPAEKLRIVCCGPEPMMEAVSQLASQRKIACEVSLETPMACGIGICFTCVAKVGSAADWDYKRTCVEGPVFDATEILWD